MNLVCGTDAVGDSIAWFGTGGYAFRGGDWADFARVHAKSGQAVRGPARWGCGVTWGGWGGGRF